MSLLGFGIIVLAAAVGDAVRWELSAPLPGPIIGIVLLLVVFGIRRGVPGPVESAGKLLLQHLSLFFVPAAVGLMDQAALISRFWLTLAMALAGSSILALLSTAAMLRLLDRMLDGPAKASYAPQNQERP